MKTASTLLPAALAALLACSGNTDDLKPKTAADCGLLQKPCGYKCVSVLDPASGCGATDSCDACPGAPLAFCDPSTYACITPTSAFCTGATERDCDGAGACEDLATNAAHCGLCWHACAGGMSCLEGVCDPESMAAGNDARGIILHDGFLYWVDDGNGGRLQRWSTTAPAFSFGYANELLSSLDTRPGSPAVFRLAANPISPEVHVVGGSTTEDFTLYRWDPANPGLRTRIWGDAFLFPTARIEGLASTTSSVWFTRSDLVQPQVWDGTAVHDAATGAATTDSVRGLAGHADTVFLGYGAGAGTLSAMDPPGALENVLKSGFVGAPHRIAIHMATSPEFAWANEFTGAVWRWVDDGVAQPVEIHAGFGLPTRMDVAEDDLAVYWTDRVDGTVWERRHDGTKLLLARGVIPNGVAVDATYVYFTDGAGWIYRVPK